ncbi:MAG: DUF5312 family protein [Brevinematia bacterium]
MPYDKEAINKAKEIGFFERKFDAEALKTDERERQKLAEKLKKQISSTSIGSKAMNVEGQIELVELPIRREEIINVELSLWDRFLMFLASIFGLMSSSEYKKNKSLKIIEQRLRKSKPQMIDFSKRALSGDFGKVILSLYEQAKLLRIVFDVFLNNENFWRGIGVEKSSCEYLFESITGLGEVVESYKDLNIEFVNKIVEKSTSMRSAIKSVEDEINFILKSIPEDLIKRADNVFNSIIKLREFAYFDFETIVRRFTQVSDVKRGRVTFKSVSPQGIVNLLRDLESILLSLDVSDVYTSQYVNVMLDYIEKYAKSSIDNFAEVKEKITSQKFFQTMNDNIRKLMITDVISYITSDPLHKPFIIKTSYSLFKEFSNVIMDKYKRLVSAGVEEKNNKLLEKYVNVIFGKNVEINEIGIYSTNVSKLFSKYGLPMFLYPKVLGISSLFIKDVWDKFVKDTINTLVVSGSFSEKNLQRALNELIGKVEPIRNKMIDFIRAVEQGGEYHVLLSRFISNPSLLLNEQNKKIVERKIIIINSLCFEFLNAFKDVFKSMYKILSYIVDDIYAPFPKTVVNIHKIGGVQNKLILENLERSTEKLNAFTLLLSLFIEE